VWKTRTTLLRAKGAGTEVPGRKREFPSQGTSEDNLYLCHLSVLSFVPTVCEWWMAFHGLLKENLAHVY